MIPTFVSPAESAELRALAGQRTVLELGTQYGYSCLEMAEVARLVVTVDWHFGDPDAGERDTLEPFVHNFRQRHGLHNLVPVVGRVEQVLPLLAPHSFDMLFHDAAHDAASVRRDLELALPLLRWGSIIAIHDWGLFEVAQAAEPILGAPDRLTGRLAVFLPRLDQRRNAGGGPAVGGHGRKP